MNGLKKGRIILLLLTMVIFGSASTVGATSSPTTDLPGENTDVVNNGNDTEIVDTENVDKINEANTETESESEIVIDDKKNDTVNSDNSGGHSDGGSTFIDRVRDMLPKTGDTTNVLLWILIMFACIAGATILVRIGIKNRPGKK